MERQAVIEMININKSFPGVIANKNVSFKVFPGEIHALLGENGAGKSTLMSILAGLYKPDSGIIKIKDRVVRLSSPRIALENGIGMIYQHFRLVNKLTVAENIILGSKEDPIFYSKKDVEEKVLALSQKYGLDINPTTPVGFLSMGEKQRVEILKMLYRGCDILIMDEPTTVLTPQEVKYLFKILRNMAEQGKNLIIITHKLNEVMEIAESVTVLRNGEVIGSESIKNLDKKKLTQMMLSREVVYNKLYYRSKAGEEILQVQNLNVLGDQGYLALKNTSFNIHRGEIIAVAGVAGNGQRELVEAIAGVRSISSGKIVLNNKDITHEHVRDRIKHGISFIPEDRDEMGLVPSLNALENSILRNYFDSKLQKGFFINYKNMKMFTQEIIDEFNINISDQKNPVSYLSGGNLQKLLLGREIKRKPSLLIAAYPLKGLDIAAAEAIIALIIKEREKGTAILLVLEDLDDIFRLADRIAVMYDGKIKAVLKADSTDIEELGLIMLGAEVGEKNA